MKNSPPPINKTSHTPAERGQGGEHPWLLKPPPPDHLQEGQHWIGTEPEEGDEEEEVEEGTERVAEGRG